MNQAQKNPHVFEFMQAAHLGVLSTVDQHGKPWGSAIYFVVDEDLNCYFVTRTGTSKYKNLKGQPHVALTVVDAEAQTTVQLAGKVSKLHADQYHDIIFGKLAQIRNKHQGRKDLNWAPPIEKIHKGEYMALKITPATVQYADFSKPYLKASQKFVEQII